MTEPSQSDKKILKRKNRTVIVTLTLCIALPFLGIALQAIPQSEKLLDWYIGMIVVIWLVSFGWIIPDNCEGFIRRKK